MHLLLTLQHIETLNIFLDGPREYGKYPFGIYGKPVLLILTPACESVTLLDGSLGSYDLSSVGKFAFEHNLIADAEHKLEVVDGICTGHYEVVGGHILKESVPAGEGVAFP